MTALVWTQFTPFFNDGDVCVFSAGGECYSTAELTEDDIRYATPYPDSDDEIWSMVEYKPGYKWDRLTHDYKKIPNYVSPPGLVEATEALEAISSGEFYDVLRNNFGEHALVVATPDRFYVEYYEHE